MKKIITVIVMGLLTLGAYAQQDAGFSMYFFNPVYVNPGYAGSRDALSGTIVHRSQWINMPGAPTTQSLSIHSPIANTNVGLGLQVYNDNIGPMKNFGVNLTYAYHVPINDLTKLSFGITGMMNNVSIGWDQIHIDSPTDPSFTGGVDASWSGDVSTGLYLYRPRFYLGLSVNHLLQSKFGFPDGYSPETAKFFRQYYLTSGVVVPLGENLDFRPSLLMKYVQAAPIVGEINASFIVNQKIFLGGGFRTSKKINMPGLDNMIVGIVELEITPSLRIGYSYDYYLNRNGAYNNGTHEIMLGWDININKTKMSSPRFF